MTLSQNAHRPKIVARPSRRSGPSLAAALPILLTKTLRDLRHRTLRSLLTIVGIVIGVAGVVAISYTARNLALAQAAVYADASQYDLAVSAWGGQAMGETRPRGQPAAWIRRAS